ncbi:MAG TPA: acyl-ACP--UDP-N-acetylglucosamine O-acyltransferase [Gemmataceae bacterium]|nr:acyl-ACP--UDP-N-acetylglucosamine O-acyltransferase [Gemmataceae bacterium]
MHPTAVISLAAELADDVVVGPHVVIENKVSIGPGCVLRPRVHLCGPLTMGSRNFICGGAVLGEKPQHLRYHDEPTSLEIGDDNNFGEHVTVHRGTSAAWVTRIGHRNVFMAHSHVAHDCQVCNDCVLESGALLAGHCSLGDHAYLSGNAGVHQFVRLGRLAFLSDLSIATKDVPPFVMQQGINVVSGLNLVGMSRAGIGAQRVEALQRAFHIIYRESNLLSVALQKLESELGHVDVVAELVSFVRESKRGISLGREQPRVVA